jgi:hypothetical protein
MRDVLWKLRNATSSKRREETPWASFRTIAL